MHVLTRTHTTSILSADQSNSDCPHAAETENLLASQPMKLNASAVLH